MENKENIVFTEIEINATPETSMECVYGLGES